MSISRTRCSATASAAAKLTAVVVFPTPPFWLVMATMLPIGPDSLVRADLRICRTATPMRAFLVRVCTSGSVCVDVGQRGCDGPPEWLGAAPTPAVANRATRRQTTMAAPKNYRSFDEFQREE